MCNAFEYIMNTTKEDQKVAKTLAGWSPDQLARQPTFDSFDGVICASCCVSARALPDAHGNKKESHNLRADVLEVFAAVLMLRFKDMESLNPNGAYVRRFLECAAAAGVSRHEVIAWGCTSGNLMHKTRVGRRLSHQVW